MLNLVPKYIFILKVVRKISDEKNIFFKFIPFKLILRRRSKTTIQIAQSHSFKGKLKGLLGDFDDFSTLKISLIDREKIIQQANNTLEHRFDILGSGLTQVEPIDWHTDFKSNFNWPKGKFYKKHEIVDLSNNADVKVAWDFSRCHHLLWLGEAYLLTGEENYAEEIVFQIEDWIKQNPLMYSVNWTCAMDVSIRVVNWMYALNMISSSKLLSDEVVKKITKSIFDHGFFIYNNLEKATPYSSNHYVANLTGLIYIGSFVDSSKEGKKWREYGVKEFYSEIRTQILPSGVQYERSISYHRLVSELFLYPYFMLVRSNEEVPNDIDERLKSMLSFVRDYTKPNGKAPLIGDNDNGRLLPFVENDFNDHNYLLEIASQYFGDSQPQNTSNIDSYFALKGINNQKHGDFNRLGTVSKLYSDAGFAILKRDDFYLFFKNAEFSKHAMPTTKIIGTHTHADALSFELSIGDNDFIIDPGSYCYTSSKELRNEFRSTKKHNTIQVDDLDQIELINSNLFCVKGYRYPKKNNYFQEKGKEILEGFFQWHLSDAEMINHRRRVVSHNAYKFQVIDEIVNNNYHKFTLYYHFSNEVEVTLKGSSVILETKNGATLKMDVETTIDSEIKIIDDTISPSFGIMRQAKTMKVECFSKENVTFKTSFTYKKYR